jgi:hypothetical protein
MARLRGARISSEWLSEIKETPGNRVFVKRSFGSDRLESVTVKLERIFFT